MKICYLSDANNIHTKKLCYFFKEKGYDISVISLNDGIIDGIKVHSMATKVESSNKSISKVKYLKNISRIKKIVNEIKPDILHVHYASSYGLISSLVNYKPTILSVWGSDVYDFPKISPIHKAILKYNLRKTDLILSTSKCMANETNKYTDRDILITPFGVDINKFYPNFNRNKDNNDEIIIGTVKTLEDIYGIDTLIKAFAYLKNNNKDKNIKLRIAGRGSKEKELKKLSEDLGIEDCVEFLGFISQDKVAEEFRSFDVAVFPSQYESFGVAAVEAQACGTPVVVSNVDGLMEATKPGTTSLVFEKNNYIDLAKKIEEILKDNDLKTNMGINARKYVEENYNIEDNFNYINEIYIDVINKKDN
ncbi:glycosyltransferase [Clostridium isatidis]|uniref:glycosyltransferase n=1 Tax=Clostridium isatidis TaxID=182773 RepID=UPI003AABC537